MFLLIYLYYEVKGKSKNIISIGLNLLHKIILGLAPDGAKGKNGRSRLHPLPNKWLHGQGVKTLHFQCRGVSSNLTQSHKGLIIIFPWFESIKTAR